MDSGIGNAARRLRAARDNRERDVALSVLHREIAVRARSIASRMGLSPQEADDASAATARRVLASIESGVAREGSEEALVSTAARRAAIDQIRTRRLHETSLTGSLDAALTYDPPDPATPVDERVSHRQLLEEIERVIPEAPPNYQRALHGLMAGRSIATLEAEYAAETGRTPSPGLIQRHRNRAQMWLVQRLLGKGTSEWRP